MQLTLAVIGCLAVGLIAWAVYCWRQTRLTIAQYALLNINLLIAKLLWRATIDRPLPIDDNAGAVIVSNHRCSVEPLMIQLGTKRVVHWMVAREYVEAPGLSLLFRTLQSIPVGRRGVDVKATKRAIRLAREGRLVGIFPEGRINTTDQILLPGRPGAAMVAIKAGVPIIPCYIEGASFGGAEWKPFVTPARVKIHVGQPIDVKEYLEAPDPKLALQSLTQRILREIARLAGDPDYEPRLAGRRWAPADDPVEQVPQEAAEPGPAGHSPAAPRTQHPLDTPHPLDTQPPSAAQPPAASADDRQGSP